MDKQKFFELHNLKKPNVSNLLKLLKTAVINKTPEILSYKNFTNFAENTNIKIDRNDYFDFLNYIFDYWYKNTVEKIPKDLCITTEFNCDSIKKHFDKIQNFNDANFVFSKNNKYSPIKFQYDYFCSVFTNNLSYERIKKFENIKYKTVRLYLNIDIKYLPLLAKIITKSVLEKDIPLRFKFSLQSNRTDSFVFYTGYEYANEVVEIIKNIKDKHFEMFENCIANNPLLATLDGYIGFGEEPKYQGSSYTSIRANILKNSYNELLKLYEKDEKMLTDDVVAEVFSQNCNSCMIDKNNFHLNLL